MLLPVRGTMEKFMMTASELDRSWPSGECEVVREAVMQWLPLECCQGKMNVLQIMQKVLTTARFTLENRSEVMKDEILKFDWPEVRLPPRDHAVAPVQRVCLCGQSFLDKYRSQYSYTTSKQAAKELHKYMTLAIEVLEKKFSMSMKRWRFFRCPPRISLLMVFCSYKAL